MFEQIAAISPRAQQVELGLLIGRASVCMHGEDCHSGRPRWNGRRVGRGRGPESERVPIEFTPQAAGEFEFTRVEGVPSVKPIVH